jgi:hypothetical protein
VQAGDADDRPGAAAGPAHARTVRLVSGPVKLTARLSRAGRTLAAASGRPRHGRVTLTVTAMRRLAPGRYRLTVTAGAGASRTRSSRSVTVR